MKTVNKSIVYKARQECQELIEKTLEKLYKIKKEANVEVHFESSRKADASTAVAFQLAQELKKNPVQIASEIAAQCKPTKLIDSISALGGFVNFTFSQEYYKNAIAESVDVPFGSAKPNGKVAIVEYSSPNVGKPLHIGHCRSTIYGEVLKKLLIANGWETTGSNFLCEAGTQVAKLIVGMRHYGGAKVKDERELLDYYVRINSEIEKNPQLAEETRSVLEKMESGDKEIAAELKHVRDLSLPAVHELYKQLNVTFDEEIYDSDYITHGKELVQEAVEKKIAFKDKTGEIVGNIESTGVPNLIILRSNGTTLYSTRDLGLAEARWKKYKPDLSVIVTGSDQNLHFRQVVKLLELLKRPIAGRIKHIGYGLIMLPEGKLSSRAGRVVFLQDVINEAADAAEKEILTRQPDINKKEAKLRAKEIGVAALKFALLKVSAEKNITFDFNKMVSFEGDTGAYLQYSLVRCKSILEKSEAEKKENKKSAKSKKTKTTPHYELNQEEKELLIILSAFPLVVENAARSLAPQVICDYLLKTAAAFSKFYSLHSVLNAESEELKAQRIELVKATANVMQKGLKILGITPMERM
ncbi:MAG: arginine--tRNA ligase [Candidatus Micrarchaeota archaeon]